MAVIEIPRSYMGRTMDEVNVKRGLRSLNPDIDFDMGVRLNIWHPFRESRQNVFYLGKSICAMDRRTIPEVPVWSMRRDLVEVPLSDVKRGEIALALTNRMTVTCQKCNGTFGVSHKPMTEKYFCPGMCGNIAPTFDPVYFQWQDVATGTAQVFRKVRDRIILVGWRHTFDKLSRAGIPGVTKRSLEHQFGVNLDPVLMDANEIDEDLEERYTEPDLVLSA